MLIFQRDTLPFLNKWLRLFNCKK